MLQSHLIAQLVEQLTVDQVVGTIPSEEEDLFHCLVWFPILLLRGGGMVRGWSHPGVKMGTGDLHVLMGVTLRWTSIIFRGY